MPNRNDHQTKNLTLEEINTKFGDQVALEFKDAVATELTAGPSPTEKNV